MSVDPAPALVDVRGMRPVDRPALALSTFRKLPRRGTLELVDDRDPSRLYYRFRAELSGAFTWTCVESGPEVWRVQIAKLGDPVGDGRCCSRCGAA